MTHAEYSAGIQELRQVHATVWNEYILRRWYQKYDGATMVKHYEDTKKAIDLVEYSLTVFPNIGYRYTIACRNMIRFMSAVGVKNTMKGCKPAADCRGIYDP